MTTPAADQSHSEKRKMTVSERSIPALTAALQRWMAAQPGLPGDPPGAPTVTGVRPPDSNGLSSTSVLFDVSWAAGDGARRGSYVARMAPEAEAVPVFPHYDLSLQFEVMSKVAARCEIPLPRLVWNVPDGGPLGTPFFVMDRVEGRVPLDNPPYVFAGWLLEATAEERAQLQRASVQILAKLHAVPAQALAVPALRPPAGQEALRYHLELQRDYYHWALADDGVRVPIIERSLDWLEEHWPDDPGPDVLNWGDARIGNIVYQGFEPAAVLDWEMAALGPRELDVGWFVFLHRFFQDIAEFFEVEGLPDFLRRSEVEQCYTELTGWQLRDMDFYLTYAALRHAIIMARIRRRMIHFGEEEVPADPDDYVMHRASLERLLAGTYRWD
ncbi:MAG TPA: phosphotransferase family protein [Streptosporangiaceae bacterium]|nr:phosphotransferase family protein [Streptosporangiaceae bacterium]